jgi:uncharacterized protein (DUF1499 family)
MQANRPRSTAMIAQPEHDFIDMIEFARTAAARLPLPTKIIGDYIMSNSSVSWPGRIAVAAGILGVLTALVALAAPAGTWLGLWEFGTGFQILFNPQSLNVTMIAPWVAIVAAVIGIGAMLMGVNRRYAGLALIGAAAAGLAFSIPASYRPGPEIPPIHDITTDTTNPPEFVDVLALRAGAPNTAVYGGGEGETPASLAEQQQGAYPDIVPQRFDASPEEVFQRALAAANSLGWDIVAEVPAEGRIEATDTTFWFRFKDDIVIRIRPDGNGAVLDARSVSRVGRSDVGKNAARLRSFFAAL